MMLGQELSKPLRKSISSKPSKHSKSSKLSILQSLQRIKEVGRTMSSASLFFNVFPNEIIFVRQKSNPKENITNLTKQIIFSNYDNTIYTIIEIQII